VTIPCAGAGEVSVLVSPGLPVFFEEQPDAVTPREDTVPDGGNWTKNVFTAEEWDSY